MGALLTIQITVKLSVSKYDVPIYLYELSIPDTDNLRIYILYLEKLSIF